MHANIVTLHTEELHNFCPSSSVFRMITSRKMRWAGYVARMGRRGIHIGFYCKTQQERDN
jgi:hypothetical protein